MAIGPRRAGTITTRSPSPTRRRPRAARSYSAKWPATRRRPVEDRDALDPFVNPAAERIEVGAALFKQPGPNGKACATCHATPQTSFKRWAVEMPKWEPRLKKVLGAEEFLARHAKATAGADWLMQSRPTSDMSIYLHSTANGEAIKVDSVNPRPQSGYTA